MGHLHDGIIWLQLPECFEASYCIQYFFFCEESLVRDTNLHNKDCSEMHSGSCSQMTSSCKCPIAVTALLFKIIFFYIFSCVYVMGFVPLSPSYFFLFLLCSLSLFPLNNMPIPDPYPQAIVFMVFTSNLQTWNLVLSTPLCCLCMAARMSR